MSYLAPNYDAISKCLITELLQSISPLSGRSNIDTQRRTSARLKQFCLPYFRLCGPIILGYNLERW